MNLNIVKKAFSLTELLIVLVIVAVLFAAMAPIATKRFNGSGPTMDSVWKYTDGNQHDAYFDSESPTLSSVAFVGLPQKSIKNLSKAEKNQSKVVVKAVNGQDMIHFRYGEGDGLYTGSFSIDAAGNIKSSNTRTQSLGEMNTIAGQSSFEKQSTSKRNVAIGSRTMAGNSTNEDNVAVGVNSGEYLNSGSSGRNTFVGANTGRASASGALVDNVAIGSNVLNSETSKGVRNVLLGANVASVYFDSAQKPGDNVILGANTFVTKNAQNNTVIGSNAYGGSRDNVQNLTSVGYNTCSGVSGSSSNSAFSTCIGNNSGAGSGGLKGFDTKGEHIYLGGTPNGFGGRSVLEVHNFSTSTSSTYRGASNLSPTVVLNSNLVVRGNTYFPNAFGKLSSHALAVVTDRKSGTEKGKDKCCRRPFRSKKWNTKTCSWLGIILGAIIGLAAGLSALITMGVFIGIIIAGSMVSGGGGGALGSLFKGSGYDRPNDILSFSSMNYLYGADDKSYSPTCHKSISDNYPDPTYKDSAAKGYRTKNACPDLDLGSNFSDIRLKENISENNDGIEKLLLIAPYNYTYKADKDNTLQVGVIAQDLQKYLPNSVSIDDKGFLQIRDDEIFYVTINSIKSLNDKLASLMVDVTKLEDDSAEISKSNKSIQSRIDSLNKRADKLDK